MYNRRMALSRKAFSQLGIDVWVHRRAPSARRQGAPAQRRDAAAQTRRPARREDPLSAPLARPPRNSRAPIAAARERQVEREPKRERKDERTEEPLERYRVHCFHYGNVFAALAEDAWPERRFLLDVALAMNGFSAAERRDLTFDWPQPGATAGRGKQSFRAFFSHQTRDDACTLIAGGRVATLLDFDAPAATCRLDRHIYVAPNAHTADEKKALWQLIREL